MQPVCAPAGGPHNVSGKTKPPLGMAQDALRGGDSHAAVGEGQAVRVAGQALLLAVVGTGGRGEGVAGADIVGVDRLPPGPAPVKREQTSAAAQQHVALAHFVTETS